MQNTTFVRLLFYQAVDGGVRANTSSTSRKSRGRRNRTRLRFFFLRQKRVGHVFICRFSIFSNGLALLFSEQTLTSSSTIAVSISIPLCFFPLFFLPSPEVRLWFYSRNITCGAFQSFYRFWIYSSPLLL